MTTTNYWPYKPTPYDDWMRKYGAQYGVDPHLMRAIASAESNFNPRAVSPVGARGLTQFMPETAADYGVTDPDQLFDPETAIRLQAQHLARLRKSYPHWSDDQLIAAYNFGEGNIERGKSWPKETRDYVPRVKAQMASANPDSPWQELVRSRIEDGEYSEDSILRGLRLESETDTDDYILRGLQLAPSAPVKKADALRADDDSLLRGLGTSSPSTPTLGDYTQYPMGSKEYFEAVAQQGGLPAIRPTKYIEGKSFPGSSQPFEGHTTDTLYPIEYKARVHEVADNDTLWVTDANSKEPYKLRFADIQGAEYNTELGKAQREYLTQFVKPGDQLTIASPVSGEDTGVHGRQIGRVYWHAKNGQVVDLSKPWDLKAATESKPGEGDPGWRSGLWHSLLAEIPELLSFPQEAKEILNEHFGDGEYDPNDSKFYQWAEGWEVKERDLMERFMAYGYDTDGPSVNIPFLGEMRLGEAARFLAGSATYTIGMSAVLGKIAKVGMRSVKAAQSLKALTNADNMARLAKETDELKTVRRMYMEAARTGEKVGDELLKRIEGRIELNERMAEWGTELVEGDLKKSAVQKLRDIKDMYLIHATDKYHPLVNLGKRAGKKDEVRVLLDRIRAVSDVSHSPIEHGVWKMVKDPETGKHMMVPVGESLKDIWQNTQAEAMHHAFMYMGLERLARDLYPQWKNMVATEFKGNVAAARQAAQKFTGKPWERRIIEVTEEAYQAAVEDMRFMEELYGPEEMARIKGKIKRTRQWSVQAMLEPLVEVGAMTNQSLKAILNANPHYAPFFRMDLGDLDSLEEFIGPNGVLEIAKLEDELGKSGLDLRKFGVSISGKGEAAMARRPVGRLTKGLEKGDPSSYIADPAQIFYTRSIAINKYVQQQRVRNLMGELIDEIADPKAKKGYGQWLAKSTVKSTDPNDIDRVLRSGMENAFITTKVVPTTNSAGKVIGEHVVRTAYITQDKALAATIRAMSPSAMSLFKNMMAKGSLFSPLTKATDLFRRGTVLGLHFMIRNPFRDQFMAAALTKYGYIPVIDWWKGLWGVVTKSPVYRAMHGAGATQSNFTAATLGQLEGNMRELTTRRPLSQVMRDIFKPDRAWKEKLDAYREAGGVRGLRRAGQASRQQFVIRNTADKRWYAKPFGAAGGLLRRTSELFEEATRTGAAQKAFNRAAKGKKYTFMRSVDEAIGGLSGFAKMIYDPKHRAGTKSRWLQARYVGGEQKRLTRELAKEGKAVLDADMVDEIRNITLDFQRRGITGEALNALYPFFNAELQDASRFLRAVEEAPLSTMARGLAFVSIPAIANWLINYDNPDYQNLPDIEKELFIHPFGYDKRYKRFGRIPRPVGLVSGVFSILPHRMLDYFAANDPAFIKALEEELFPGMSVRKARDGYLENMYDLTEPMPKWVTAGAAALSMGNTPMFGYADPSGMRRTPEGEMPGPPSARGESGWDYAKRMFNDYATTDTALRYVYPGSGDLKDLVLQMAPQGIAPLTQIGYNRDPFFKTNIVPQSIESQNLQWQDMYTENTSPLEYGLAAGFNKLPLGMETDPIRMGHLIRRYTGSLGSALMAGADFTGRKAGLLPERPGVTKTEADNYLASAFWGKQPFGSNSQSVRDLYAEWDKVSKVLNSLDHNIKDGTLAGEKRIGEITRNHPEWIAADIIKGTVEEFSELHRVRRGIKSDMNISDEERTFALYEIDQYMTELAYLTMEAYRNIQSNPEILESIFGE